MKRRTFLAMAAAAVPVAAAAPSLIPRRRRTPVEWAEEEMRVPDGPRAGEQLRLFRFQREILESLGSLDVQFVDIQGSAQWGKTLCLIVYLGWSIAEDPASILYVMPSTQGSGGALDFSRERITPLIARTPCLAALVHGRRESGGSNTAASKTYPGGSAAFVGANAPAGLASRPVRRVLLDEVDRFPTSLAGRSGKSERGYSIGEGDVYSVVSKRTETFGRQRTIARVSTPVNVGGPIDSGFKAGDQRRFVVACPHCRSRGILGWLGVDFGAKTKVVAAVGWTASNGADAALTCRECGAVWSESDRAGAVAAGEWVAERTDAPAGRRSYHVWAAYSPMSNLPSLAADYLAALATAETGDTSSMVTFRQATLGLPVGDEGVVAPSLDRLRAAILARRTDPAGWKLPDGTQAVGAVDVHGDRLEYAVWAFAPGEESWRLHHEIITGSTLDPETWERLGAVIQESHHELPVERVAVDGGYRTVEVDAFVSVRQRHARFILGRAGRPLRSAPRRHLPKLGVVPRRSVEHLVGVDEAKSIIMSRLPIESGPGTVHLPTSADEEDVLQLTAEEPERIRVQGRDRLAWRKLRDRNEGLDLAVYALWCIRDLRRGRHA